MLNDLKFFIVGFNNGNLVAAILFAIYLSHYLPYYGCLPASSNTLGRGTPSSRFISEALSNYRTKRVQEHIINECMLVASKPGHYYYKSSKENYEQQGETCGVYLMADPDQIVQIHFDYIDMPCDTEGLVSFVDGWELNGSYFPSDEDYKKSVDDRFVEYCGKKRVKKILESSQNAALIRYRIPPPGKGFSFYFTTKKNQAPCNVLVESEAFVYTLRNYGQRVNCSLMAMNPAKIKILSLTVGGSDYNINKNLETGTYHNCEQRGADDFVQIGGGVALGDMSMTLDTICGVDSVASNTVDTVFCGVTTVRLVSSEGANNQVTVSIQKVSSEDPALPGVMCPADTKRK